jgi:hypothetical protein
MARWKRAPLDCPEMKIIVTHTEGIREPVLRPGFKPGEGR